MHPAAKQLDGRMQTQVLPSSLTVMPVFMASNYTTKTSAILDSNARVHGLELHYQDLGNAEQLDTALCHQAA